MSCKGMHSQRHLTILQQLLQQPKLQLPRTPLHCCTTRTFQGFSETFQILISSETADF